MPDRNLVSMNSNVDKGAGLKVIAIMKSLAFGDSFRKKSDKMDNISNTEFQFCQICKEMKDSCERYIPFFALLIISPSVKFSPGI